ncbi:glycerate kinase [Nocardioides sp. SYSU D00038]|uniref:glycerate kinase n=1 Tax=Nocardioides sp. SYSU D00038 TaxID=2812554 RepID=UPI0019673E2A|nr:glycerate kinase [Nocardioides sp. SYSU D00038]
METSGQPALLVAPDKFRGTATAREVAEAVAAAAGELGWRSTELPLSDGGEGLLEAFGGPNRATVVTGPLGDPVTARWRFDRGLAVVESAEASGLLHAGGAEGNDPVAATSRGTGELLAEALAAGAREVVVGLGGTACTDGGRGAWEVLREAGRSPFGGTTVTVCADVGTRYLDAAAVFGPQKGATPAQVEELAERLVRLRDRLAAEHGRDPQEVAGSGAAGGLGGALAVLGARVVSGFDHVADRLGLDDHVARADLVVTGEGRLDASSFAGKVVGGVVARAQAAGRPVAVVVGDRDADAVVPVPVRSLVADHGRAAAMADTLGCLRATAGRLLSGAAGNR